jgi:IS30 family transposase
MRGREHGQAPERRGPSETALADRCGRAAHAGARAAVGCSTKAVQRLLIRSGGLVPQSRPRSALRLSLGEREEISCGLLAGDSCRAVAARMRRAPSTASREDTRAGGAARYRAWRAKEAAVRRARRPNVPKLAQRRRQRTAVQQLLARRWSPQQIADRLVRDYPDDQEMRVARDHLPLALRAGPRRAPPRAGALYTHRADAAPTAPTTARARRAARHGAEQAEAADRAVPGHWEGNLILERGGRSAIGTLTERKTRLVMHIELPQGRTAELVRPALARRIRTLTWDRGRDGRARALSDKRARSSSVSCRPGRRLPSKMSLAISSAASCVRDALYGARFLLIHSVDSGSCCHLLHLPAHLI